MAEQTNNPVSDDEAEIEGHIAQPQKVVEPQANNSDDDPEIEGHTMYGYGWAGN